MSNVPSWWEAVFLAGAAFRVWRLIAQDTILDEARDRLVKADSRSEYRQGLDEFLRCPWCMGFWVSVAWWIAWLIFPHATVVVAVPWAISAAVGLIAKADA